MDIMDYDRAVRLRTLWNGSFGLRLQIQAQSENIDAYSLTAIKEDISLEILSRLGRLTKHLGLNLVVGLSEIVLY